jgi:hypothetical protein
MKRKYTTTKHTEVTMSSILGFLGFLFCIPVLLVIIIIWWEVTKSIINDIKELFKILKGNE